MADPNSERAIDELGAGDVLVLDCHIERIHARGASIKVPHLDLTTPIARGVVALQSHKADGFSGSVTDPIRPWNV